MKNHKDNKNNIKIGGFDFQKDNSTFIIAELSANHNQEFNQALKTNKKHYLSMSEILDEYKELDISSRIKVVPYLFSQLLGINNNMQEYMKNTQRNEDRVISMCLSKGDAGFKVASVDEAIGFSFECDPRYMYQINNNRLPFGCHAWPKYDLEFWRPFIEARGYKI
jgi:hypothetical protein